MNFLIVLLNFSTSTVHMFKVIQNGEKAAHSNKNKMHDEKKKMKLSSTEMKKVMDRELIIQSPSIVKGIKMNSMPTLNTQWENSVVFDEILMKNNEEDQDSRDLQVLFMSTPLLTFAVMTSIYFFLFGVFDIPPPPSVAPSMSVKPTPFTLAPAQPSSAPTINPGFLPNLLKSIYDTLGLIYSFYETISNPIPTPAPTFSTMPSMKPTISNAPTSSDRPSMSPSLPPTNNPTSTSKPSVSPTITVGPSPQPQSQPV